MKTTILRVLLMSAAAAALGGCSVWDSIFGGGAEPIDFENELGPNTEALVDQLPEGLIGDSDNTRYFGSQRAELPDDGPD